MLTCPTKSNSGKVERNVSCCPPLWRQSLEFESGHVGALGKLRLFMETPQVS